MAERVITGGEYAGEATIDDYVDPKVIPFDFTLQGPIFSKNPPKKKTYTFVAGQKIYELGNHLGNVLVTISDRKLQVEGTGGKVKYYLPDVLTMTDYYPFGSPLSGRTETQSGGKAYRFGFNGKEKTDEWNGEGNIYDYGFRIYDPRIGKFLSVDPLTKDYPWYTPYQFAGNMPICAIDLDGAEELLVVRWYDQGKYVGQTYTYIPDEQRVKETGAMYANADIHNSGDRAFYGVNIRQNENGGINLVNNNWKSMSDAQTGYFFQNGNIRQGVDYSPTLRNEAYEGEALPKIKSQLQRSQFYNFADGPGEKTFHFDYDEANPFDRDLTREVIAGYMQYLRENPDFMLLIEGHSSEENNTGRPNYNQELSERRANSVKSFMVSQGIPSDDLSTVGKGSSEPVNSEHTEEAYQQNRRIVISNKPK